MSMNRRDFIKLTGLGGAVFASGLGRNVMAYGSDDFYFVQLSDIHWGFNKAKINPDYNGTLKKAIAAVNGLKDQPDFVVFTGDLTHTTDDPSIRRKRMAEFREIASNLKVKDVRFLPGEHDASLDNGKAYQEFFGELHYTFDHKGIHFIALDNVSDPRGQLGQQQLAWLEANLKQLDRSTAIVVLTHRPLFALYPKWGWATRDGEQALELLKPFEQVTVFYGHIHQEHHHTTGHIAHHSSMSLMLPLPAPGSVAKKKPIAWDPAHPYKGMGFRNVEAYPGNGTYELKEHPIRKG